MNENKTNEITKYVEILKLLRSSNDFKNIINWNYISQYGNIEILEEFEQYINWYYASMNKNLNIKLIIRHQNDVNWLFISEYNSCIFDEFKDNLDCYC